MGQSIIWVSSYTIAVNECPRNADDFNVMSAGKRLKDLLTSVTVCFVCINLDQPGSLSPGKTTSNNQLARMSVQSQ